MFFKVPALLLVAFGVLTGILASPVAETNGERLARGLPPSPPKFMKRFTGTPVSNARRSGTSSLPPATLSGRLRVRSKENGSSLGNVRNWSGGAPISGTNFLGPDQDLLVEVTYSPSDPSHALIRSTNPNFPAPFYVGASTDSTLAAGARDPAAFTNVESTSRNAPIWTINPSTKQLTAQYINPDGSLPPTIFSYDIRNNRLFFTGDLAAYNTNNPFPASAVDLYLVPV